MLNNNIPTECTYDERLLGVKRMLAEGIKIDKVVRLSGFDKEFLKKLSN